MNLLSLWAPLIWHQSQGDFISTNTNQIILSCSLKVKPSELGGWLITQHHPVASRQITRLSGCKWTERYEAEKVLGADFRISCVNYSQISLRNKFINCFRCSSLERTHLCGQNASQQWQTGSTSEILFHPRVLFSALSERRMMDKKSQRGQKETVEKNK